MLLLLLCSWRLYRAMWLLLLLLEHGTRRATKQGGHMLLLLLDLCGPTAQSSPTCMAPPTPCPSLSLLPPTPVQQGN